MREPRIRGGAHVGRDHAQWGIGIRVPVRVFARHDRAARSRRALLRKRQRASPRRQLDGVGEEAFRCGAARHGGVLLHSDGTSPVTRYGWVLTLALALPPALEAQDIGLAVGTQAPAVTVERSEEHTSELQSHSDLVCRLLLEKKNRKKQQEITT